MIKLDRRITVGVLAAILTIAIGTIAAKWYDASGRRAFGGVAVADHPHKKLENVRVIETEVLPLRLSVDPARAVPTSVWVGARWSG